MLFSNDHVYRDTNQNLGRDVEKFIEDRKNGGDEKGGSITILVSKKPSQRMHGVRKAGGASIVNLHPRIQYPESISRIHTGL